MNEVQKGTKRYKYPTVPTGKKVQIGTTPFRGVPFVPTPKQALDTDLLGHEIQIPKHTNDRPEAAALCEVLRALRAHPLVAWCERMNSGAARVGGRFIRFGFTGCPDVLGMLRDGRLLGVEVKAPKGKLRPEQAVFLERIRSGGGVSFVAHDLRDVHRELNQLKGQE